MMRKSITSIIGLCFVLNCFAVFSVLDGDRSRWAGELFRQQPLLQSFFSLCAIPAGIMDDLLAGDTARASRTSSTDSAAKRNGNKDIAFPAKLSLDHKLGLPAGSLSAYFTSVPLCGPDTVLPDVIASSHHPPGGAAAAVLIVLFFFLLPRSSLNEGAVVVRRFV